MLLGDLIDIAVWGVAVIKRWRIGLGSPLVASVMSWLWLWGYVQMPTLVFCTDMGVCAWAGPNPVLKRSNFPPPIRLRVVASIDITVPLINPSSLAETSTSVIQEQVPTS